MPERVFYVNCPACQRTDSVRMIPGQNVSTCWKCNVAVRGYLFPAIIPKPPPLPGGHWDKPGEGESVCFYNPERKATGTCDQCGVFISDAWKAKWGSKTLCLRCLEKMSAAKRGSQFENTRVMWDNVVLGLALAPMIPIVWYMFFLTAPAALVIGIWAWKKPTSLVPRSKARLVIGIILAALQVVGLLIGIYFLVNGAFNP